MKYESTLDGLIKCLQTVRKYAGGDTPVSINLISNRNIALQSIYYDYNVGGEETVYIEGDYEDRAESSAEFSLFETRNIITKGEEKDKCTICGEPIKENRARQDENENIVCEDCFMHSLTSNKS